MGLGTATVVALVVLAALTAITVRYRRTRGRRISRTAWGRRELSPAEPTTGRRAEPNARVDGAG